MAVAVNGGHRFVSKKTLNFLASQDVGSILNSKRMEVFKNDNCTVYYSERENLLTQVWKDFASFENFKNVIDTTVVLSQTRRVRFILSDTTKQRIVSQECSDYAQSKMPLLVRNGLKKMAFVLSESALNGMAVKKFTQSSKHELVNFFDDEYAAKSWLHDSSK